MFFILLFFYRFWFGIDEYLELLWFENRIKFIIGLSVEYKLVRSYFEKF